MAPIGRWQVCAFSQQSLPQLYEMFTHILYPSQLKACSFHPQGSLFLPTYCSYTVDVEASNETCNRVSRPTTDPLLVGASCKCRRRGELVGGSRLGLLERLHALDPRPVREALRTVRAHHAQSTDVVDVAVLVVEEEHVLVLDA